MTQNTITVYNTIKKPTKKKDKKNNDLLILQGQKSGIYIQYLLQSVHKHAVPTVLTQ